MSEYEEGTGQYSPDWHKANSEGQAAPCWCLGVWAENAELKIAELKHKAKIAELKYRLRRLTEPVDVIASGYEWTCPVCDYMNSMYEYSVEVRCDSCGVMFNANPPEHAYD